MKPDFYDSFQCTADQCSMTCCKEWRIEVDGDTYEEWKSLSLEDDKTKLTDSVKLGEDGYGTIKLNKEKKCPFLNKESLCRLVMKFGDGALSKTCAIFPRETHEFENRTEYTMATSCPTIVDFLKEREKFSLVGEREEEDVLFYMRDYMMKLIQDTRFSISKSFMMAFYVMLELSDKEKFGIEDIKKYEADEILSDTSKVIDGMRFFRLNTLEEDNELFLDLAENYRKEGLYESYLEPVAQMAERISEGIDSVNEDEIKAFEERFSAYDGLMRNYLAAEIFHSSLLPESSLEGMIVMAQWIALEYASIRHAVFLKWLEDGKKEISYEMVRDYIVVISRMTGYDEEDIHDYLIGSFESLTWDWGYFALILGNGRM
ncbi:MAG: hypothetical protein E7256_06330 [Lachnospiraceae bacterium]|nr:hypothetical protein [Lachnospiraceae bacterium]